MAQAFPTAETVHHTWVHTSILNQSGERLSKALLRSCEMPAALQNENRFVTKDYRKHKKKNMLNNLYRYVALEINTVKYVLDIK